MDYYFSSLVAENVVCYCLSLALIGFRLYVRHNRAFRPSDYAIMACAVALPFFTAASIFIGYYTVYRPNPLSINTYALAPLLFSLSVAMISPLTRLSIVLLFLEIEPGRIHQACLKVLLLLIGVSWVLLLCTTLFSCEGIPGFITWSLIEGAHRVTKEPVAQHCIHVEHAVLYHLGSSVVLEVLIFCSAMPFVYKLKASLTQKLWLIAAFSAGLSSIGLTASSAALLVRAYKQFEDGQYDPKVFWESYICFTAEINYTLAIANMLPLRGSIIRGCSRSLSVLRYKLTQSLDSSRGSLMRGPNRPVESDIEIVMVDTADMKQDRREQIYL